MAILAKAGIHVTRCGATVLNGIAALVRMTEAAARMNADMGGHFTSKRLSYAPPSAAEMEGIKRYYGPGVYRSVGRS